MATALFNAVARAPACARVSSTLATQRLQYRCNGFLPVAGLLTPPEVTGLRAVYDDFLAGRVDARKHRYDLGSGEEPKVAGVENITQIMWPSDVVPALRDHAVRARCLALARALHADDTFQFDFDMLIAKAPGSATPTPPHQDESYWPDLPDKRAISFWVALDPATLDNGCMWYGPRSHDGPLRPHRKAGAADNAGLVCDAAEAEMTPVPLDPGAVCAHAGRTLHYSRGNATGEWRRAYILNFRPAAMIEAERAAGFDHGRAGQKKHTPQKV